ncbi:MAG: hypothetical protein ACREUG_15125 [Steroidobacteraceae bacterium]
MSADPITELSDGRYYFEVSAASPIGNAMGFVGNAQYLTGELVIGWQITQAGTDGSAPQIEYSTDGGQTFTTASIGSANSPQAAINESGSISVSLAGAIGITFNALATGGQSSGTALPWIIAIAITRNANESTPWDSPNPFDPISYNAEALDFNGAPSATLAQLRTRMMIRLGFASQASNPPPGMASLVNEFLSSAQAFLYRRYAALHTRRFFRWKVIPGQRFYSLKDNDENVLASYHLDPSKNIEWVGIQDRRNVWYPIEQGIPPELYTRIAKPWRPFRYDIRQAIELYPVPNDTYWLWVRGHFGLLAFAADADTTTLDSELVFLHALANGKAHYGQPDANNIEAQANTYLGELIAGTHQGARYIPHTGARAVPAIPRLIKWDYES